MGLEKVQHLAA
ncbi:Putative uncharacterized protein [Escherichia coli D6-117.29]|nr:Protein of unknown function [Escherichia coli D6-113.11]CDP73314.1 Protein of unknown function [Escherichia coli]CDP76232.1 Putative uncharacterized protein [Escherichia coli D6-117.29]CDU33101.1 Protein of unknown function [Escherichia coli D6-113.11]CDU40505.1 Protein of unknown function [Escherichia coli]